MPNATMDLFGSLAQEFRANPRLSTTQVGARFTRAAMTYLNLQENGGALAQEHAQKFVHEMLNLDNDWADFLNDVDFDLIGPTGRVLDSWELDDVGDIRAHGENTETDHVAGETTGSRSITPKIIDLIVTPSYERIGRWVRRSVGEGAKLGQGVAMVLKEIQKKMRRELQNLFLNGDTDSSSAHLAIMDGWIKYLFTTAPGANLNGTAWAATPDVKAMMMRMRRRATQVRRGSLLKNPAFGYIMSEYLHDIFVESLANATSDSGMKLYVENPDGSRRYKGRPIYTPNYLADDFIAMGLPKNLGAGISDEISRDIPLIEYTRKARKGQHEFVARVSTGCNIAKTDITIIEYDNNNSLYTGYVAA